MKCFFLERETRNGPCPCENQYHVHSETHEVWVCKEDGREFNVFERLPIGAMFFCENQAGILCDHIPKCDSHLVVIAPNGLKDEHGNLIGSQWDIDSRASNCTLPNDFEHCCWVRHGSPPNITVDKNGKSCAAGAGSIWMRFNLPNSWHGFLTNGVFRSC